LHNAKTNWDTYRNIPQERTNLSVRLQADTDIERESSNLISLLQQAAKESTPNNCQQEPRISKNININTTEIKKKLVAKKKTSSIKMAQNPCASRQKNIQPVK
jgi:hypothetical protein